MHLADQATAYTLQARHILTNGPCVAHPEYADQNPLHCAACAGDRKAARDETWLRENAILRAMAACDRLYPLRYRDAVADQLDVLRWVRHVADNPNDGSSLLLLGKVGRGKSWQAYGTIRAVLVAQPHLDWAAVTFADFAASLRPRPGVDSEAEMGRYREAGILLLDDIGAAKGSEWVEEITYRLVNGRYDAMRPTIFVSNLGLCPDHPVNPAGGCESCRHDLRGVLGDRVRSRMAEMCRTVVMEGPDRRRMRPAA